MQCRRVRANRRFCHWAESGTSFFYTRRDQLILKQFFSVPKNNLLLFGQTQPRWCNLKQSHSPAVLLRYTDLNATNLFQFSIIALVHYCGLGSTEEVWLRCLQPLTYCALNSSCSVAKEAGFLPERKAEFVSFPTRNGRADHTNSVGPIRKRTL